ncbi:MAG: methyltransferase domain-containing protein [Oricola sp.]
MVIPAESTAKYCIPAGYKHRLHNRHFDDTPNKDEFQNEVYQAAFDYLQVSGGSRVFDIGCGSGFKLMKFFSDFDTVGFDVRQTVEFLRQAYSDREWRVSDLGATPNEKCDVMVCADVVEHIPDPDMLMRFMAAIDFDRLFLSTPDRDIVRGVGHRGPPQNKAHCREWNSEEFAEYVGRWFKVEDSVITNRAQGTQMVVCSRK